MPPTVYQLKPRFQALLRPTTNALAAAGITANQVTIAAVVLSAAVGPVPWITGDRRWLLAIPAALLVRMALNAIDGMLAREHGQASRLGVVLNELGDVASDAALYGPLAATGWFRPELIFAIVILAAMSELAGVMGQVLGGIRQYQGPMGKSDRALVFGILCLAVGAGAPAGLWVTIALAGIALLLVITIINRVRAVLRSTPAARNIEPAPRTGAAGPGPAEAGA